jgi:hypothetical protein
MLAKKLALIQLYDQPPPRPTVSDGRRYFPRFVGWIYVIEFKLLAGAALHAPTTQIGSGFCFAAFNIVSSSLNLRSHNQIIPQLLYRLSYTGLKLEPTDRVERSPLRITGALHTICAKPAMSMEPTAGVEPAATGVRCRCSGL